MINFAIQRGNIKNTLLENVSMELSTLSAFLTTATVTQDKLNAGYFLCTTGTARTKTTVDDNASLLVIDGDKRFCNENNTHDGAVNPALVHELLADFKINHVIHTTFSNNVDLHKFRLVIPCKYHRSQLDALLWRVFQRLHENEINLVDAIENHDYQHAWFMPSYPPERANLFKTYSYIDGRGLDVDRITSDYERQKARLDSFKPTISKVARQPIAVNSTSPIIEFNANFTVHDILIRNDYKQIGKRYLHPNSSSKIAGVRILDDGRVYSDSSDALNDRKSHDAFDCYRILECSNDYRVAMNWNHEITKANRRAFYGK